MKSISKKVVALNKLIKLIENEEFIDLDEADRRIDWREVPKIELK